MKLPFNPTMSAEEINTLVEGWSDSEMEELFDIPFNRKYLRQLNKKNKERFSALNAKRWNDPLDNILDIMNKYEGVNIFEECCDREEDQ